MCCYLFCDFKNERETGLSTCYVRVRKDLWDSYWERTIKLYANPNNSPRSLCEG